MYLKHKFQRKPPKLTDFWREKGNHLILKCLVTRLTYLVMYLFQKMDELFRYLLSYELNFIEYSFSENFSGFESTAVIHFLSRFKEIMITGNCYYLIKFRFPEIYLPRCSNTTLTSSSPRRFLAIIIPSLLRRKFAGIEVTEYNLAALLFQY